MVPETKDLGGAPDRVPPDEPAHGDRDRRVRRRSRGSSRSRTCSRRSSARSRTSSTSRTRRSSGSTRTRSGSTARSRSTTSTSSSTSSCRSRTTTRSRGFVFGAARPRRRAGRRGRARRDRLPRRLGRGAADRPADGHVRLAPRRLEQRLERDETRRLVAEASGPRCGPRSVGYSQQICRRFSSELLTKCSERRECAPMATAGSLEALRELNRLRVIDALRQRGTASRSELAAAHRALADDHHHARRTTSRRKRPRRRAAARVRSRSGRGRPPTLLRLDPSAGRRRSGSTSTTATSGSRSPTSRRRCSRSSWRGSRRRPRGRDRARRRGRARRRRPRRGRDRPRAGVVGVGSALSGRRPRRHRRLDRDPARLGRAERCRRADASGSTCRSRSTTMRTSARSPRSRSVPAAGLTDVIYVMVSSGIGAGIVLGGQLHRGVDRPRRRARARARTSATAPFAAAGTAAASRPSRRPTRSSICCGRRTGPTSRSATWSS